MNLRIKDDKKYYKNIKKDLQKYESVPERIESLKDRYQRRNLLYCISRAFIKELRTRIFKVQIRK